MFDPFMIAKTQFHSILCLALVWLLLQSSNIHAQWIESTGTAQIRHGNKNEARNKAVQNAIKDALMFAGASVSSIQKVTDGLLTQDDFMVSSQGSIQQLELVDELYQQGMVSVTIRADIIAQEKQCFSSDFQKSIAITQFRLTNREQAKVGSLYDIGKAFSKRLYNLMSSQGLSTLPRPWYQQKINSQTSFEQYFDSDLKIIDTIGQSSESQFVLLGQITDLSFGEQTTSDLAFWSNKATERYFTTDLILYNTSTKEQIYREQFETVGDWTQGNRRMADIAGGRFWRSDYGIAIDGLVDKVKTAIEEVVHCQPLQGKIVRVQDNQIQFNLGVNHGISKGQVFSIIHQSHFINQNGKHLPRFVISPYQVEVIDVYTKTAVAKSINDQLLGNIQTTDYVILKEVPEFEFE
jgi:hypothetical protein